ncbi:hypothetical protein [Luteibacter sp. 3190]|uniref:hypothetical protein n=1 Tax=Luteibacter sp. 3190 TaxID=2817736 RepID=UPI002864CF9C|nr:hypothetical protein [Luteibacter sp. 3190]MDR6938043.1 hypothetical protein [Luteibacter sp. 3190]
MPVAIRGPKRTRPFALWRIVVWIMMLLAAVGFVIHAFAAVVSAGAIGAVSAEALAAGVPDPRVRLMWSLAYALAAFVTIAVTLSALRWRAWSRSVLRVIALVLAVWFAWTAWIEFGQWKQVGAVLAQAGLSADDLAEWTRRRTILLAGVVLKLVSIPVLAWLAWVLGSLRVRQQFAAPSL